MHWTQDPANAKKKAAFIKKSVAARKRNRKLREKAKMSKHTSRAEKAVARAVKHREPKAEKPFIPPVDEGSRTMLYAMAVDTLLTYNEMGAFARELGFGVLNRVER